MTCPVLTEERMQRVLSRTVSSDELDELRAHLETSCEACLERLATAEGAALLVALGGPEAELSEAEADEMFAAVAPPDRSLLARLMRSPLAAAAMLAIVALGGGLLLYEGPQMRDKGTAAASIDLFAFAAKSSTKIDRSLRSGDAVSSDDRVLFRYALGTPAYVYVWVSAEDGLVLAHRTTTAMDRGEHEVAERGQVLAMTPSGDRIDVVAAATDAPIDEAALAKVKKASDVARVCPKCGTATLWLRVVH